LLEGREVGLTVSDWTESSRVVYVEEKKRKVATGLGWGGGEGGNFSKNRKACVVLAHTTNKTCWAL
jgi:hypothetical protein